MKVEVHPRFAVRNKYGQWLTARGNGWCVPFTGARIWQRKADANRAADMAGRKDEPRVIPVEVRFNPDV